MIQMISNYSYVALLDVLGYIEGLKRDKYIGKQEFGNMLYNAVCEVSNSINDEIYKFDFISDTIIAACNDKESFIDFIKLLKVVMTSFLKEGIFLKGAVSFGVHQVKDNFTYSHALSRAAELERHGTFPRIVIDSNIIEMIKESQEISKFIDCEIICVENGIFFINIIDSANWELIYKYGREIYLRNEDKILGNETQYVKHLWFENYIFSSNFANTYCPRYIPTIRLLKYRV